MDFNLHYGTRKPDTLPAGYSFDPIEGFQQHASESIESLLARLSAGDLTVAGEVVGDDEFPFDEYPDAFDVMDEMVRVSERTVAGEGKDGNSVSSDSKPPEQALADAQGGADSPGETDVTS